MVSLSVTMVHDNDHDYYLEKIRFSLVFMLIGFVTLYSGQCVLSLCPHRYFPLHFLFLGAHSNCVMDFSSLSLGFRFRFPVVSFIILIRSLSVLNSR
jgi:hypothetical protein